MFSVSLALIVFVIFLLKGIKIMIDYDAWLEKPYQDECQARDDWDRSCERYAESDSYWEDYEQWAAPLFKEGIHCSTEVWVGSKHYEQCVENYIDRQNEPPDPPEDREYRTRGWG